MRITHWIVLGAMTAATACDKEAEPVRKETREAVDAMSDYTFAKKEEFMRSLEQRLDEVESELAKLQARAKDQSGTAREKFDAAVANLRTEAKDVRARMSELGDATEAKWNEVRDRVRASVDSLAEGVKKAWSDLKG